MDKILYETPHKNHEGKPYLTVKECADHPYVYAQRAGVHSVAFILWDGSKRKYGVRHEFKPPINDSLTTAFGGSLDKEGKNLFEIVTEEVREEAGYALETIDRIVFMKSCFVSTQMNQFCHLYLVDVTFLEQNDPISETEIEKNDKVVWHNIDDIISSQQCWKSSLIVTMHRMALTDRYLVGVI